MGKILDLAALTGANVDPANDQVGMVDVSDTAMDATGTNKKISVNELLIAMGIQRASLSSNATANSTVTGVKIGGLDLTLAPGTYKFEYWVRYQSTATTTGIRFGVNHTGTVTSIVANLRYQESTTAASTGAASQAAAGGTLHAGASCRAKSTTAPNLGPTASVDTLNADMLAVVEGLVVVTVSGTLELWHASETTASSQVMSGSSVVVTRVA